MTDPQSTSLQPDEQAQPTHRIKRWGFCSVCRHDCIPDEGCARTDCPDAPGVHVPLAYRLISGGPNAGRVRKDRP